MENNLPELKEKSPKIRQEIKEKLTTYLTAAFGFVAGLAWNDAIKGLIDAIFPIGTGSILAKFIYAIFVTILIVILSIYLVKIMKVKK